METFDAVWFPFFCMLPLPLFLFSILMLTHARSPAISRYFHQLFLENNNLVATLATSRSKREIKRNKKVVSIVPIKVRDFEYAPNTCLNVYLATYIDEIIAKNIFVTFECETFLFLLFFFVKFLLFSATCKFLHALRSESNEDKAKIGE